MVKVIDFEARKNDLGESFNVLIVQGGVMPVISKETGKFYVTIKKASVPCTLDSQTCEELIGSNLEGTVVKVETEPYSYAIEETGETIQLDYRYEYVNEGMLVEREHMVSASEVR
ncbi:hypothetical protein [Flagellimonas algicola]|uniref:Uncharacterized protein n=1 Tax=Flagellimonas algicola TaxID=2583815 RepID=A0ABY2WIZ1_9FLAO|nr:hypothetical protein [Allomuricauda algicola]TMU54805.1 hypothetical protein FGG15_11430 [Allomuricauda algicola]